MLTVYNFRELFCTSAKFQNLIGWFGSYPTTHWDFLFLLIISLQTYLAHTPNLLKQQVISKA